MKRLQIRGSATQYQITTLSWWINRGWHFHIHERDVRQKWIVLNSEYITTKHNISSTISVALYLLFWTDKFGYYLRYMFLINHKHICVCGCNLLNGSWCQHCRMRSATPTGTCGRKQTTIFSQDLRYQFEGPLRPVCRLSVQFDTTKLRKNYIYRSNWYTSLTGPKLHLPWLGRSCKVAALRPAPRHQIPRFVRRESAVQQWIGESTVQQWNGGFLVIYFIVALVFCPNWRLSTWERRY